MKYKVKRAFFLGKTIQEVGSMIELTGRDLIGGLKSFDKIEPVSIEEKPVPMTTETVDGLICGVKQTKAKETGA